MYTTHPLTYKHYDDPVEYYTTFLDSKWLQYSYCDWTDAKDINEAEENKMKLFGELLDLKPTDVVYEGGCGFGGTAGYLKGNYGSDITGFNLSEKFIDFARERYPAKYEVKDFLDIDESIKVDKIYFDGMLVHHDHRAIFNKCRRLLKPNGRIVFKELFREGEWSLNTCLRMNETYDYSGSYNYIEDDVKVLEAMGATVTVTKRDIHGYIISSNRWLSRMFENKERLIKLVGKDKFRKDVEMLLAFHEVWGAKLLTPCFVKAIWQ